MSEKHKIQPFDQIRFTRTEHGWTFELAPKGGGHDFRLADHFGTFDEAVAKAKERFAIN